MKELIVASNPAKKRRSAAQKAATRKLVALNRRRGGGGTTRRKKRRTTTRRQPIKRRRTTSRRRSPQRRYARRRNPTLRGGMMGIVNRQVIPALVGGAGGVANDVLYGFLPLPMELQTGNFRHVGKAISALLLAWGSSFVVGKKTSDQIGAGALTVVGYNVVREVVSRFAPDINMGMFLDPEMGMFLDPSMAGYPSPGLNPDSPLAGMGAPYGRRGHVRGAGVEVPDQLMIERPYGGGGGYAAPTMGYADMDAGGYSEYQ